MLYMRLAKYPEFMVLDKKANSMYLHDHEICVNISPT